MSASIVRQALEISSAQDAPANKSKTKNKNKLIVKKKKKQLSGDKILKQNLKILKALDSLSTTRSKKQLQLQKTDTIHTNLDSASSEKSKKSKKSSKKRKAQSDSVFTDEDFAKFEAEYFVTD